MSITLPGGTALVTGAGTCVLVVECLVANIALFSASGIGRAAAHAYAKAGVSGLVVADLRLDALDIVVEECKRLASNASFSVIAVEVDVSQESKVIAMVERTVEAFGGIDYAANNAGVATAETHNIVEASLQEWERVHSVNSTGVFLCIREEVKAMIKQQPKVLVEGRRPTRGAIVNVASIASLVGVPYAPTAYVASKHVSLTFDTDIYELTVLEKGGSWSNEECRCSCWRSRHSNQCDLPGIGTDGPYCSHRTFARDSRPAGSWHYARERLMLPYGTCPKCSSLPFL